MLKLNRKIKRIKLINCLLVGISILFVIDQANASNITMVEDCQNGLDDDGDGLIDLNDVDDCICSGTDTIPFTSLIPNSSFERINDCPYDYAQLEFVQDWIQASEADADYYNICNFAGDGDLGLYGDPPQPLPNGNGYVGLGNASSGVYKEYIGACLNGPMLQNTDYTLQLNLGFGDNGRLRPFSPFEINIFGTSSCANLPFEGQGCPLGIADWFVIGTTFVSGEGSWELVTYDFRLPMDVNAIAIGPGCTSHHESYYWLDNLQLNETVSFEGCPAYFSVRDVCGTLELQSDHVDLNCEVQWYHDGIAIQGATNRNYEIPPNALGDYQMMLTSGGICNLSDTFKYENFVPGFVGIIDTVLCQDQTIELNDEVYSLEGIYVISWSSEFGCDTTYNLTINRSESDIYTLDTTICSGMSVVINGVAYTSSGQHTVPNSNSVTCDSLLDLTIKNSNNIEIPVVASICNGQTYLFGDIMANTAGTYETLVSNSVTCDTLYIVELTVEDVYPLMSIEYVENPDGSLLLSIQNVDPTSIDQIMWTGGSDYDCASCLTTNVIPRIGQNDFRATIIDSDGCSSEATISVDIRFDIDLFVPNSFTPNDDGINDYFNVYNVKNNLVSDRFQIYNRFGDIIYNGRQIPLNNPIEGWNGKVSNEIQPEGVYIYVITFMDEEGRKQVFKGDVTLLR